MTDEPQDPPVEDDPPPVVPLIIYCAVCGRELINLGYKYTHGSKALDRNHAPQPTTEPGGGGGTENG